MDFSYNKSQLTYRKSVLQFVQANKDIFQNQAAELDQQTEFNQEAWKLCGEFGLLGGPIAIENGGAGLDLLTFVSGLEALGEHCLDNGLLFSMGAHILACALPIQSYGNDEQRKQWLPDLCSGKKIAAIAIAEAHGSSDAFNIHTTATEDGDSYIINGKKSYITNASIFDVALVFARVSNSDNKLVCLLVDKDTPGMTREPDTSSAGLKTSPWGNINFENCRVNKNNKLGASAEPVFMSAMEWERGCILTPMVGAMQRQIRECIARVTTRKHEDQPLSQYQAVSHRIVDMKMRAELSRLLLYNFVWVKQTYRRANMEAVMTKLYASESILQNALDAMQIHGAYGYTTDAGYERQVRDALGLRIASGTSDIQRNIIAKWLKL